jgi:hypothetical protein
LGNLCKNLFQDLFVRVLIEFISGYHVTSPYFKAALFITIHSKPSPFCEGEENEPDSYPDFLKFEHTKEM